MKKVLILLTIASFSLYVNGQKIPKMKMADVVRSFTNNSDTVYVVNFWATFCKPCVGEIPYFISICNKYKDKKVKLLLVSLDLPDYYPAKIAAFVKKNHFNTNIAWLSETNADIFCPMIDKKWSGAIPATIIVNGKTGFRNFFEDDIKAEEFETIIKLATARSTSTGRINDHSFDSLGNLTKRNPWLVSSPNGIYLEDWSVKTPTSG